MNSLINQTFAMDSVKQATLFSPARLGRISLAHRVVMAPLTRSRSEQPGDVPGTLMREYYQQRASEGGLIISEATTISMSARSWYGAPGLYTDAQVEGWKRVVGAVHDKGGRMVAVLLSGRVNSARRRWRSR